MSATAFDTSSAAAAKGLRPTPAKIVVGTDFDLPSVAALNYAVTLAKALQGGASVHVVHGVERPIVGMPDGTLGMTTDVLAAQSIEDAERSMTALIKRHERAHPNTGIAVTTSVIPGDPREVVLDTAEREDADMIVLGTHGRQGLARALIGSIAEQVIRRATIPVVTVHAGLDDFERPAEEQAEQD